MLNCTLRNGMFAGIFALVSISTATGQVPVKPVQATDTHYRATQIIGSKVLIANNTEVGTVDDIVFDDAGNLEYLIVNNEGRLTTMPFEAAQFDLKKRIATVVITAEQYKAVPTYTTTTYPNFYTPDYRTQIYKTYNINPRELRRIERRTR